MTAQIIDGKAFAAGLRARVAALVPAFHAATGRTPGLAVVLVGEDPASTVYVRSKGKATREVGMESLEHRLPDTTTQGELIALVEQLNDDPTVDGILVQLPLPAHLDAQEVLLRIDPDKDVDGFHPINAGRLATGVSGFVPCTPWGCVMLLEDRLGDLSGLDAVVIGRSNIVGKPMAALLTARNATVTLCHSRTRNLPHYLRHADIVVAAIGRSRFVQGDWLKPGATVIDVGMNREDGRLTGDVDFDGAASVAGAITPVPGGVGPMTIACLLRNTLVAAHRREGVPLDERSI
ncbi:bifunctional methylenetetrahydrofolate dehydrogenase/methenyltetrahydrofolate cyclohydrolase FolD [Sphingomonas sp. LB-2]|uniref:bifunctional methylenetetrahydrofolate dehydrogenase/methenyltetrahydrofolate cyclohydrolase FolD n=1 Tax=Sphingomonas caeni TaxID=2984949 RepID=UPI002231F28D|nr:bifunctional methylenetetrahydrofolate dehydrogenase/methenyltetrahydrofolate cyclohydrolase FolD [Sphingomonas caeni]MCW3846348.1 bifunctional methylenetetrahydrofolate dehydrogenase/methenyltetrahydrofolate cyclohydrolase FolD [Sphingomonas caeni]